MFDDRALAQIGGLSALTSKGKEQKEEALRKSVSANKG